MPRVALHTLGCKVNQYETQKIAQDFVSRGFEVVGFPEQADVYVVNTCTVTRTADSKSRQAARGAVHRNPDALVVVTGCYAETSPERLSEIEGVGMVVGNNGKAGLAELVANEFSGGAASGPRSSEARPTRRRRTRALLKVQDGCDQFCSYCVVPFARPVMSSRPSGEVLAEARELAGRGFKEIVLTGIRLGCYKENGMDLVGLADELADIPGIERIRLSSIELTDTPDGLIDLMARNRKLCRHLHVPLQSGDDEVLAGMNRPYSIEEFASFVRGVRDAVPGVAVTTDIMVGFPGETDEQFEKGYDFARRMRFARMHVFRYSPRPLTAAGELRDDVPAVEKGRRSARMMDLAVACSHEFAETLVGTTLPVLVEGKRIGAKARSGLTDNYVRVVFEGAGRTGDMVCVRVESVTRGTASGVLVA